MEKAKLNELKKMIEEADKYHSISMDENLTDEENDAAYAKYWNIADKAAALLKDLIKIDDLTAKKMVHHKKAEITALINRMES